MSEIDRWLANLDLELSGASLNPLEGFVLGGDVFNLTELRGILTQAKEARRQALEEAAKVALNPGFIQARDDEWDTGFNEAKRVIAQAIRDMKTTPDAELLDRMGNGKEGV